ncbi:hypothetical protein RJ639_003132, partial [Escallonia herrerae]
MAAVVRGKAKLSAMAPKGSLVSTTLTAFAFLLACVALPSLSSPFSSFDDYDRDLSRKFEIDDDMFRKDGEPFQIIGGDVHYFRVHPEYWEDRLLRAKALGLNTIQTYVPWNLHEPRKGHLVFEGIANIVSFLQLCQKLNLLVMLRAGPYICAEWDFGGFPAWLLSTEPALKLRSSEPDFLELVEGWWGVLLPKVAPLLYENGGPLIMVQIENEFGSYGDDKAYLHHLVTVARRHLGENIILYTTDGGSRENLEKGTIRGDSVFSAVDFSTGDEPWPIFELQKEFNAPGKSPPLSASLFFCAFKIAHRVYSFREFYTGWLTHWGENIANTDATFTATALEQILSGNGSAVLYMAHGGTNFGFYNGANTGGNESEYKPDLTSYDYDAPIRESGDVENDKFKALRRVIKKYSATSLPSVPPNNEMTGYGRIQLEKTAFLFDILFTKGHTRMVKSENPVSMEATGQMFGFILYVAEYISKDKSVLSIPMVNDRAQVFVTCPSGNTERPRYAGVIERWSNKPVDLHYTKCDSKVENMGRVNYGPYLFDRKGILSAVYLDGNPLLNWKMLTVPFHNLNEAQKSNPIFRDAYSNFIRISAHEKMKDAHEVSPKEPAFYAGRFVVDNKKDTFISFSGWGKGIAFVNEFNIGRFWPAILEVESPNSELVVTSVDRPDFMCGSRSSR